MRTIAVDQGTTSTRSLVLDAEGGGRIVHSERHSQRHPQTGWVEHDPLELLSHVEACLEAAGPADAIGIDNQGESCLAWDHVTGEPLSPVIVWQDARTTGTVDRLRADGAEALTLEHAGLPLDPYFSATKLGWLYDRLPAGARTPNLRLGTTDSFFLRRLTGIDATDITTASRTSLMRLSTASWDGDLCGLFGVPVDHLPPIRATVGDFGTWRGMPVTASVVDQQAALYGHGCRAAGDTKITFGTGAFVLALTGQTLVRDADSGLLPTVAWQIGEAATYALDGGVYNAGSAIEWVQRLGLIDSPDALAALDRSAAIDRDLVCVPALDGLGCPHWDRRAGALWLGMDQATGALDLAQATLEGVALLAADVVVAMRAHISDERSISIDGGLVRSEYFCHFLASVLDRPVTVPAFDELTALGCAQLAAGGNAPPLDVARTIQPDGLGAERRTRFAEALARSRDWRASS